MNVDERTELVGLKEHWVNVPETYRPNPELHLNNMRDKAHFDWVLDTLHGHDIFRVLDVGGYDGWMAMILRSHGYKTDMVELIPGLAVSAARYAAEHGITDFLYYIGEFNPDVLALTYDVIIMNEVLEHIQYVKACQWVEQAMAISKIVLISLPGQNWRDNPQHMWTPTMSSIKNMCSKYNLGYIYKEYPGTDIPGNWMITIKQ